MNATVQKWGNSLALRIPGSLAREIHVSRGCVVDLAIMEGNMVVKPRRRRSYSLSQLLRGMTKINRHSESDWGRAAGGEAW